MMPTKPVRRARRPWYMAAILAIVVAHSLPAQSRAAGGEGEVPRAASDVINTVMSPYCPGLLLANCPSPSADSLRRAIVSRAAGGASEAQLRADLVASYGEQVLAAPPMRGLGVVAWVAPFLLLGGIGVLVVRWLRAQRAGPGGPAIVMAAQPAATDPADVERLERVQRLVHGPR
jgi:cytochrome c-type biogenesis protein CcmH/NrfF